MDKEILYTIGEVSKLLGINSSKVRFWLKEFPEYLTCIKTKGGQRRFTYDDYLKLKKIKTLTEDEKLTLEGVRKRLILEKEKKSRLKTLVKLIADEIKKGLSEDEIIKRVYTIL